MKIALKLFAYIFFGIVIVYGIYSLSDFPNKNRNGFLRDYISLDLITIINRQLPEDSRYVVGLIDDEIVIASWKPELFYLIDKNGRLKTETISPSATTEKEIGKDFDLLCDSNKLFFLSKRLPYLLQITGKKSTQYPLPNSGFPYLYVVINNGIFTFQRYLGTHKVFCDWEYEESEQLNCPDSLAFLTKEIDSDGQLMVDKATGKLVYMYYYQNKVLTFNREQSKKLTFNTIDTITNSLKGKQKGPILIINQRGFTVNGNLFVSSNLKSDNESSDDYFTKIPLDKYNLLTGKYLGSYYLPLYNNSLIKSIVMIKNHQIAILYHNNRFVVLKVNHEL